MAMIEVKIGDVSITSENGRSAPTCVKELTMATAEAGSASHMVEVVVFDDSWVVIPELLALGSNNRTRETEMTVSFGWMFADGHFTDLRGDIIAIKYAVAPEGITYTLRGYVGKRTVPLTKEIWPVTYKGRIDEVVRQMAASIYGLTESQIHVEETIPTGVSEWTPTKEDTPNKFLEYLRKQAVPANPIFITKADSKSGKQPPVPLYASTFSSDGHLWFCTDSYHIASATQSVPIKVRYPYPANGSPVVEISFAEVEFNSTKLLVGALDRDDPDPDSPMLSAAQTGAAIEIGIPMLPGSVPANLRRLQDTMNMMSKRTFTADLVTLGNPNIQAGVPVEIVVATPQMARLGIKSHLDGTYTARTVVHAVANDSYITRCHLRRDGVSGL
jgi:hypothetical protein